MVFVYQSSFANTFIADLHNYYRHIILIPRIAKVEMIISFDGLHFFITEEKIFSALFFDLNYCFFPDHFILFYA